MKKLAIKLFGDKSPIAIVTSNLNNTFTIQSTDTKFHQYISDLINNIANENPTLPLTGGDTKIFKNRIEESSIIKNIPVKDIDYLSALGEYFTNRKISYNNKRLRGFLIENA